MIMATVPKTANQMTDDDPLSTVKFLVTVCFLFFIVNNSSSFFWLQDMGQTYWPSATIILLLSVFF
ncbi:hypothetical protein LINPERPRIM_LOCUS30053 [Linum perenne]